MTLITLIIAALIVASVWRGYCRQVGRNMVDNRLTTYEWALLSHDGRRLYRRECDRQAYAAGRDVILGRIRQRL